MRASNLISARTVRVVLWLLACGVMVLGAATACGSSNKEAGPATTAASQAGVPEATLTIDNFTFTSPPSVSPGALIAVKNSDPAEHSVTADTGDAFNVEIDGGESATFTAPTKPGTYDYHCSYHPMMHGQLIVK